MPKTIKIMIFDKVLKLIGAWLNKDEQINVPTIPIYVNSQQDRHPIFSKRRKEL